LLLSSWLKAFVCWLVMHKWAGCSINHGKLWMLMSKGNMNINAISYFPFILDLLISATWHVCLGLENRFIHDSEISLLRLWMNTIMLMHDYLPSPQHNVCLDLCIRLSSICIWGFPKTVAWWTEAKRYDIVAAKNRTINKPYN